MPDIKMRFHKDVLILEGAMGTMLQREDIPQDACFPHLNILDPELIASIHSMYKMAGAQCAITNTFGATRAKLTHYGLQDQVEGLNRAAVRIARSVHPEHVLADVGPCGLLLEPLGTARFEEVFEQYQEQVRALALESPDAILIETMADIADARCALLAAKSVTSLPVIVSCTFNQDGRMDLSGTDPATCAIILESAGADAVGMNCGLGPESLEPLLAQMADATSLPLIIQPNAGIPVLDSCGETLFPGTADEMAMAALRFRDIGAQLIGACCGSTPAFTAAIDAAVGHTRVIRRRPAAASGRVRLASPRRHVDLGAGQPCRVIGERINPTGKPTLTAELQQGVMTELCELAGAQVEAGADVIDVNVGVAGIDEGPVLRSAALALQGFIPAPLVFDSTSPEALEQALRVYPGRALINSVNGDPDSISRILPLAKRYGAAVLVLTLDESGIPTDVQGRMAVAKRVREAALGLGLSDNDLIYDFLTMTAATDRSAPLITLGAVRAAAAEGLCTVLGVSNVSHGLPDRATLNASFAALAVEAGLTAAIVNPNNALMMQAMRESALLTDDDELALHCGRFSQTLEAIVTAASVSHGGVSGGAAGGAGDARTTGGAGDAQTTGAPSAVEAAAPSAVEAARARLATGILRGECEAMPEAIDELVAAGMPATRIIDATLTPTLQDLGAAFEQGKAFLPQMMIAANAMKAAVAHIKSLLPATSADEAPGRVVFATVKGDIHSIGKDICIALIESQGFKVIDLGVDVPVAEVVRAAADNDADIVALSALMTTSLKAMEATVEAVHAQLPQFLHDAKRAVFVGGAVVNAEWAAKINARYSTNAASLVEAIIELRDGRP
jgi:5-methyltetrahydrofolate--homocysteine methyltransferase